VLPRRPGRGRATRLVELRAPATWPELLENHAQHAMSETRRTVFGNPSSRGRAAASPLQ
jgi:hypothetical protein